MVNKEKLAQKLIDAVNENSEFCKAFLTAENAEDLQNVLKSNGFEVSLEEVEALFADGLKEILKFKETATGDEVSEELLDNVTGGGFVKGTVFAAVSAIAGFGFGAFCGVCPAAAVATPYVVTGLSALTTYGYAKGKIIK